MPFERAVGQPVRAADGLCDRVCECEARAAECGTGFRGAFEQTSARLCVGRARHDLRQPLID